MRATSSSIRQIIVALLFFSTVTTVFADTKKWYPGHYMLAYAGATTNRFTKIYNEPNFTGALVFHLWRELEPAKGVYNFDAIATELSALQAHNKHYALQIADKTFSVRADKCVPDYMVQDPKYGGGQYVEYKNGKAIRCTPKRWTPAVMDRLIALYTALGQRFDAEPYFVAIQTTENAVSLKAVQQGYTIPAHIVQLQRGMAALVQAFPHTQVFQKVNWKPKEVSALVDYAKAIGAGIGGPDLLPNYPTDAYPFYRENLGKLPLAIDAQSNAKDLGSGLLGFLQLFLFAVINPQGLQTNYVFWSSSEKAEWSFDNNVKPIVNLFNGYINTSCPLNIVCQ